MAAHWPAGNDASACDYFFNEAISITNLYLTSLFNMRSYAVLMSLISIFSISETILCSPQK